MSQVLTKIADSNLETGPSHSLLLYAHSRGKWFSPLPSTKVTHSLSHSPLPVLPIFELQGAIRHSGAVKLGSRIKKTQLLTTIYELHGPKRHSGAV